MKKIILFAVSMSAVLLGGCLPQERIAGRVVDGTGPVPGAAVLAMVWVEDTGKALPAPEIRNLDQQGLDAALEKDMKDRGLPMAYARAFTDGQGAFALEKLYFSAETKKAVKAMTQPKITRITVNVFQRGYLKHAATRFPKGMDVELPPAVVKLSKPESWKQLALDNYFRQLRRDEFDNAYSKAFGATKEEKKWFLDYMASNLNEAYQASNIKGDKQWEEDCGRDFGDIIVSTAGMQRNPEHERCNELLREMGILRDWEKLWLDHALVRNPEQSLTISAVKEAIYGLGAEYAEVKQYEGKIIEGVTEAEKAYRKGGAPGDLHNGLKEASPAPGEATRMYNDGDKAGAYKAFGYSLFQLLPGDLKQGAVTAMLQVTVLPKIREAAGGFYLLMNRPLTAQLPGGDGGNHKDKPGYKADVSTGTPDQQNQVSNPAPASGAAQTASTATEKATAAKTKAKKIVVKDYKSFKEYVASEEANLKVKPITTDNGPVWEKMKEKGMEFSSRGSGVESTDGTKMVYVSPDKKGVAVLERSGGAICVFNAAGELLTKIQPRKFPEGRIGFSNNRVFEFKGGFEDWVGGIDVYDFSGKLIKSIADSGSIEAYMFSHNQKWFVVSTTDMDDALPKIYFILYDMDGKEIWRKETMVGDHPQIGFSRDDKYVNIKLPTFHKDVRDGKSVGFKWAYVFRVSDGHLISEGHYED